MANTSIIEIGQNDTLETIARKCNDNFKRVSFASKRNSNDDMRREVDRANQYTDNAVSGLEERVSQVLADAIEEITNMIPKVSKQVVQFGPFNFGGTSGIAMPGAGKLVTTSTKEIPRHKQLIGCQLTSGTSPNNLIIIARSYQGNTGPAYITIDIYDTGKTTAISGLAPEVTVTFID